MHSFGPKIALVIRQLIDAWVDKTSDEFDKLVMEKDVAGCFEFPKQQKLLQQVQALQLSDAIYGRTMEKHWEMIAVLAVVGMVIGVASAPMYSKVEAGIRCHQNRDICHHSCIGCHKTWVRYNTRITHTAL